MAPGGHKLGKEPATYDSRDIRYADVRPASLTLPTAPPPHGGFGGDFSDWGELGNGPCDDGSINSAWAAYQGAGDCAWAGPAHEEMESAHNAKRPIPRFTCLNVLEQYSAYSGYDLQTGNNDGGSDVREVLRWRRTKGLADATGAVYKIGAFVSLELGNLTELWEALWLFEKVGIGINFPTSAMDQFNAGKMWSVVAGAQIDGGHYIPLVGHPSQDYWTCVTWAKRQGITPGFITKYCDEAWAYFDAEDFNAATGETRESFTAAEVEQYLAAKAQQITGSSSTSLQAHTPPVEPVDEPVPAQEAAEPPVAPESSTDSSPQAAPLDLPEVPLESFGGSGSVVQGQRSTTTESTPDPDEFRKGVFDGQAQVGSTMPPGPFPGLGN